MVFALNAPKHWDKGLPVVPLHGKAAFISAWQSYNDKMPTAEERAEWLIKYKDCNMGLPLGAQSRCVALDIDTTIESEIALIDSLVPISPWVRVGRKGKVLMFKYNGEATFRIKDSSGRTICELLSSKTQVVLPPSIHPDTNNPYVANCELVDVIDRLPVLPNDIETILRNAFVDKLGIQLSHKGWTRTTDFVSKGSRDVKMTSVAGLYANAVLRGEMTLREAIDIFRAWCCTQTEQVAGDPIDVEKGVQNLVKFLLRNVLGEKKKQLPKGWDVGLSAEEKQSLGLEIDEDANVSWDFNKIRAYLKEKYEELQGDEEAIDKIVDFTLDKISKSLNMTSLDIDRALKHIANLSKDIKVPALRKRLLELQSEGILGLNHTEIARAVLKDINEVIPDEDQYLSERDFNSLRYTEDTFWRWGGSNWERLEESEILRVIAKEYGHLPAATKASDHSGIMKVMKSQLDQQLADVDSAGVNFANGFVDVMGKLHPHARRFGCKYTLPYRYLPEMGTLGNAPKFAAFLRSVWGQDKDYQDKVDALREVIASTIFGYGPSFARAVLLYGIGQSGKTQLLTIVENLLPREVISYVTPYDFSDKFKCTELSKSVLNVCGELDEKFNIPAAQFKQVIDGTIMQGQYKQKQIFNFKPKATHWFASNHLPHSKDTTEGFNRRWIIFTFNRMVPKEEKIRGLGDIIVAEEREAIASWAIGCMRDLHKKSDYTFPKSHFKMITEMCSENDSLFFFLTAEEGPKKNEDCRVETDRLYEAYKGFCYNVAGTRPIGLRKFYTRLKEMGIILGFKVGITDVEGLTLDRCNGSNIEREW